jgi:hypothetical protein
MNTEDNNSIGIIFDAVNEINAELNRLNGTDLILDVLAVIVGKGAQK